MSTTVYLVQITKDMDTEAFAQELKAFLITQWLHSQGRLLEASRCAHGFSAQFEQEAAQSGLDAIPMDVEALAASQAV